MKPKTTSSRKKLAVTITLLLGLSGSYTTKAENFAMAAPMPHDGGVSGQLPTVSSANKFQISNDPEIAYKIGRLYETGKGVTRNNDIAFRLYQYAAINGVAEAQFALALMYSDERGPFNVADAQQQALFWMEQAANRGHKGAQFSYQYLLENTHYAGC